MTEDKHNPGRWVFGGGLTFFFAYFLGGGLALLGSVKTPPVPYIIGAVVIGALTIFIASVVGAYYAGKGKR